MCRGSPTCLALARDTAAARIHLPDKAHLASGCKRRSGLKQCLSQGVLKDLDVGVLHLTPPALSWPQALPSELALHLGVLPSFPSPSPSSRERTDGTTHVSS